MEINETNLSLMEKFNEKVNLYLYEPSKFFKIIKSEPLLKPILIFFLAGFFSMIMSSLVNLISKLFMPRMFASYLSIKGWLIYLILLFIILIIFFLIGLIIHFFARFVFRGEANYKETMKVLIYSSIPIISTMFFILGGLFSIYSLILSVIGLSATHNISKGKSFISILFPLIIVSSVIALIILGLF